MIRIFKDPNQIPASLLHDNTQADWEAMIQQGRWIESTRYQQDDTRARLASIYHQKCAFCEKSLLDFPKHVEHFRPKQAHPAIKKCDASFGYYWLCFSWDNLLWVCGICNSSKGSCFDITATRAQYAQETFQQVHQLSGSYQASEQPLLFHPELEDPAPFLGFQKDASVYSDNPRLHYTIEHCRLNRTELLELRMKCLNDLRTQLDQQYDEFQLNRNPSSFLRQLAIILKNACDQVLAKAAFSAWLRFILQHAVDFLHKEDMLARDFNSALHKMLEKIQQSPKYAPIFAL